ncbi:MAG: RNA methyltransferase [Planctomycetaceae bacterium]|nr:RNA methyltransferase [Planctomycetaceae bacterium]
MPVYHISSLDDPRLDPYRNLRRSNKTRWSGQFVVEGHRVVRRLIESGLAIDSIAVTERREHFLDDVLPADVPLLVLPFEIASQLVGYGFHHGVMACGIRPPEAKLDALVARMPAPPLIVACPRMTDPDNMGGLIRLCAGFGVGALLLGSDCSDPFSRRVLRVSMGAAFTLPVVECYDLTADLQRLRAEHGFRLLATVLGQGAKLLAELVPGGPTVLLLGNESDGLAQEWIDLSDERVTIPMTAADSLNVTVAAGIFLHWLRFGGA